MDSRGTPEILAISGFKNLNKQKFTLKSYLSMFFDSNIPFILNELKSKKRPSQIL